MLFLSHCFVQTNSLKEHLGKCQHWISLLNPSRKGPNVHALVGYERKKISNSKSKQKGKGKVHAKTKKEGYSKPFNDSSRSKGGKGKKGNTKCGYRNHSYHPKSTCMKKQID
jgi:hypothetical protein